MYFLREISSSPLMTVWAATSARREYCSADSRSAIYTLDLGTESHRQLQMHNNDTMSRERQFSAVWLSHTCWRVSRAPLCCWLGHLWWLVEAYLTAPPLAASGGRKSRKYEPQSSCGRKAQMTLTLSSLSVHHMAKSTSIHLCIALELHWTQTSPQINGQIH